MHKRGWCRPKVQSKKTIKLSRGVRKWSRVRLHSSQRLRAVSKSGHLQDGANSTFSSADNLRFNACTNMDIIDNILVFRMHDFDVKYVSGS